MVLKHVGVEFILWREVGALTDSQQTVFFLLMCVVVIKGTKQLFKIGSSLRDYKRGVVVFERPFV